LLTVAVWQNLHVLHSVNAPVNNAMHVPWGFCSGAQAGGFSSIIGRAELYLISETLEFNGKARYLTPSKMMYDNW